MVRFRENVGGLRKAVVKVGEDSFDVEYETPGAADALEADLRGSRQGAGAAALWLCAKSLRSWSLPVSLGDTQESREKALNSLASSEALLAIYLELKEGGVGELKN